MRLPFGFFLRSLASEYGDRAVGIVLSGTGADGSVGLRAVREEGGLVIALDPREAAYDGMARNAIVTGAVQLVLPLAEGSGYRVSETLRDVITFAVQDVLIDPPFSRIDLVSCRNMLIYLQADEQEKVLHLFHFALRDGGYLWLGSAERVSDLIG